MGGVVVEACHPKNEYLHCWNPQEDFCEGWYHQVGAHLCHLGVEKKKKRAGLNWPPRNCWRGPRGSCCGPCQALWGMMQMVHRVCNGEGISGLPVVPAKTGVWQGEWRQTFNAVCMGYFRQIQTDTACVKVRKTVQRTLWCGWDADKTTCKSTEYLLNNTTNKRVETWQNRSRLTNPVLCYAAWIFNFPFHDSKFE